jgi:hypothetical protein
VLTIDRGHQLASLACPAVTAWVTVDQSGDAIEGDPARSKLSEPEREQRCARNRERLKQRCVPMSRMLQPTWNSADEGAGGGPFP